MRFFFNHSNDFRQNKIDIFSTNLVPFRVLPSADLSDSTDWLTECNMFTCLHQFKFSPRIASSLSLRQNCVSVQFAFSLLSLPLSLTLKVGGARESFTRRSNSGRESEEGDLKKNPNFRFECLHDCENCERLICVIIGFIYSFCSYCS